MNRASGLPLPQSRATPIGRKFRAAPGTRGNPGIVVLCVAANNSPDWRPSGIGRLPGPPHALALLEMGSSGPGHRCVLDLARSGEGVHQQCDWDFSSQDALRGRKRRGLRVLSSHGTSRCAWRGELGGVSWPQVCCYLDWHRAAPWTLRVTGSQTSLVSSGASSLSTQLPFSCLKPSLQLVRFFDSSQGLYGQRLQF